MLIDPSANELPPGHFCDTLQLLGSRYRVSTPPV
jgi:hypothetical protein